MHCSERRDWICGHGLSYGVDGGAAVAADAPDGLRRRLLRAGRRDERRAEEQEGDRGTTRAGVGVPTVMTRGRGCGW